MKRWKKVSISSSLSIALILSNIPLLGLDTSSVEAAPRIASMFGMEPVHQSDPVSGDELRQDVRHRS